MVSQESVFVEVPLVILTTASVDVIGFLVRLVCYNKYTTDWVS